jgi:PII-like signaling protein
VNENCLKLTTYFGERDRTDGRFLADALLDLYERQGLQVSALFRGSEGFGLKHRLHTDRLLTLSEDLPIVSVAVDARERIEHVVADVEHLTGGGLITLERARLLTGRIGAVALPAELGEATKLTVYAGRKERIGGEPAFRAVVELLRRRGVAGATVLLGVDGTAHGMRRRAKFFGSNPDVPLMIISVGSGPSIAEAAADVGQLLPRPVMTLERVLLCKRDGRRLAEPPRVAEPDDRGLATWQKLMVYAGEQSRHAGHPLHTTLMRRLREAELSGATTLRGIWGYQGDHEPHGDRFWSLRRHVPMLTVIVDAPERIRRAFAIVDELTDETGVVTSELVPVFRARSGQGDSGGLRLADDRTA